jgi:hypothetical protein
LTHAFMRAVKPVKKKREWVLYPSLYAEAT